VSVLVPYRYNNGFNADAFSAG